MERLFFCLIISLFASNSLSQTNSGGNKIKPLRDNPLPFAYLHIIPLNADACPSVQIIGYGIKGSYQSKYHFSADIKYLGSLSTNYNFDGEMHPQTIAHDDSYFEITGRYFFKKENIIDDIRYVSRVDRTYKGSTTFGGKRYDDYDVKIEYFTYPGLYRKFTGLRSGYNMIKRPFQPVNGTLHNGTTTKEVNKESEVTFDYFFSENTVNVYTYAKLVYLNFGITKIWIRNGKVYNEALKKKYKCREHYELFGDLLVGKPKFATVYYSNRNTLPEDQSTWTFKPKRYSPLGWRFGFNLTDDFGNLSVEAGSRPGIPHRWQNFYVQAGISAVIGFNFSGKKPGDPD